MRAIHDGFLGGLNAQIHISAPSVLKFKHIKYCIFKGSWFVLGFFCLVFFWFVLVGVYFWFFCLHKGKDFGETHYSCTFTFIPVKLFVLIRGYGE